MPDGPTEPRAGKAYYVTTPIYYVNDAPHIGHAYTTVAGDVLTRWHRQRGEDVWYLTGTDEHGQKVLRRRPSAGGVSPAGVDRPARRDRVEAGPRDHRRRQRRLHPDHRAAPHASGSRSSGRPSTTPGEVYEGEYEGPYCVGCEEFKLPSELLDGEGDYEGQKLCPIHGRPVEMLTEKNYFFRLSDYADRLLALYEANPTSSSRSRRATRCCRSSQRPAGPVDLALDLRLGHPGPVGRRRTSSTSGSTRCSTTPPPSGYGTDPRAVRAASGRPTSTSSARTSCASTPSSGRRC